MRTTEKITVSTADNVPLKGLVVICENPVGVIQFNGGTAAKKEYYLPFLEYLADNGFVCCLWDYRGSGESAPKNLATCDYTVSFPFLVRVININSFILIITVYVEMWSTQ